MCREAWRFESSSGHQPSLGTKWKAKAVTPERIEGGPTSYIPPHSFQDYGLAGPNSTTSFHYVYVLVSEDGKHRYVGLTQDLKSRLAKHSKTEVSHTSKAWGKP